KLLACAARHKLTACATFRKSRVCWTWLIVLGVLNPAAAIASVPAARACPLLAAVRRRLSANEVTPDSRPGCHPGVELSNPKSGQAQRCMTLSRRGTKRLKSACPTRDNFGPFTRPVIIINADLGAFTELSRNDATGLKRPE